MKTPRITPLALVVVAVAGLGAAAGWSLRRPQPAPVRYQRVTVHDTVLVKGEPDTVIRWQERLVYPRVKPEQVATAPGAGRADVDRFCGDGVQSPPLPGAVASTGADSAVQNTRIPPAPASLIRSGERRGSNLTLWYVTNDGSASRGDYPVGPGDFSFRAAGDSVVVQRRRGEGFRRTLERAALVGIGAGVGYLLGGAR